MKSICILACLFTADKWDSCHGLRRKAGSAKEKSYEPDRGPRPEMGYIALQHHDDTSVIYFRKVTFNKR